MKKILLLLLLYSVISSVYSQNVQAIINTEQRDTVITIVPYRESIYNIPGDTSFIKKKVRMPVWSYHDFNTTINGFSFGFSRINSFNNVTSNGVRIEAIGSGLIFFPMGIYPFFVNYHDWYVNKADIATEYHNRLDKINGINFSLFGSYSINTITNGLLVNGLINNNYITNGISIAGLNSSLRINNGIQISGLWTTGYTSNGIQIAAIGIKANEANGLQFSLWNDTSLQFKGLQLGGYNYSGEIYGLQIGIFNSAKILKGLQIGLWNKNSKRSLPIINWGF